MKNVENVYRQKFLENFNKRKKQCRLSYLSRRSQRINLQEVSGQILKKKKLFPGEEERKSSPEKDVEGPEDVRRQIAEFERKNKITSVTTGLLFHYTRFDALKPKRHEHSKYFEVVHEENFDEDSDPCLVIHILCNEIGVIYIILFGKSRTSFINKHSFYTYTYTNHTHMWRSSLSHRIKKSNKPYLVHDIDILPLQNADITNYLTMTAKAFTAKF
ncbi:uncharacterized protein LOC118762217 [Octopus sinensis]|uniref:Uncharacterized protein LOC118762217 n=1 Tax=Octopus sinensis TaxID=2607531 RepID=A0A7E6EPD7_9MOLL|nr:uncharacterized protein LOC118762217 [Octopus sinensis]